MKLPRYDLNTNEEKHNILKKLNTADFYRIKLPIPYSNYHKRRIIAHWRFLIKEYYEDKMMVLKHNNNWWVTRVEMPTKEDWEK
jgi:hypothetical protein